MSPQKDTQTHSEVERGEASQSPPEEPPKTQTVSSSGRQSSIYSLTLDELQNTFSENGKNFGSVNIDEFLSDIWMVEENEVTNESKGNEEGLSDQNKLKPLYSQVTMPRQSSFPLTAPLCSRKGDEVCCHINKVQYPYHQSQQNLGNDHSQPTMPSQGSFPLTAPLCSRKGDEVWCDINKVQYPYHQSQQNLGNDHSQFNFGEMTLDDFLIQAGVVRESRGPSSSNRQPAPLPHYQPVSQHYGIYQSTNSVAYPKFGMGPVGPAMPMWFSDNLNAYNDVVSGIPAYQMFPQTGGMVGDSSAFMANGKGNGGPPEALCFNGPVVGNGPSQPLKIGSSESPVSSNGMGSNPVENSNHEQGKDMGEPKGKKRIIDDPEELMERRQKRKMMSRESAARSRARNKANTLNLEKEFIRETEFNAQVQRAQVEVEERMKQRDHERLGRDMKRVLETKAEKIANKLKTHRRTISEP